MIGLTDLFSGIQTFLFATYLLLIVLLPFFHWFLTQAIRTYRAKGNSYRRVVIMGADKTSQNLATFFHVHPEFGYSLRAQFGSRKRTNSASQPALNKLKAYVLTNEIEEIYCSMARFSESELADLIGFANRNLIQLKLLPGLKGFNKDRYKLDYYGKIPVLIPRNLILEDMRYSIMKRIFDVVISAFIIVTLLSWVIPILALIIHFDSKGPIFFMQRRSGFKNRDFYCFKLRTMYSDAGSSFKQASNGDARITRVGAFLRSTSLDELPQFFNVLSGDMSIIGPRPHPTEMTSQYKPIIEDYMARLSVKPGISGMSQVFGFRGETKELTQMRNRVKMDNFYIQKWSFWLDVKIIFWTVRSLIKGQEEAY
jgi:exopolysaccharide biosynthesis polyprenyl glycosylphosphotransferase